MRARARIRSFVLAAVLMLLLFSCPSSVLLKTVTGVFVQVLHEDFMTGFTTSERYCGNVSPENLTAVSSVQFVSGPQNYSGSGYGFKAVYSKQFRECRESCMFRLSKSSLHIFCSSCVLLRYKVYIHMCLNIFIHIL